MPSLTAGPLYHPTNQAYQAMMRDRYKFFRFNAKTTAIALGFFVGLPSLFYWIGKQTVVRTQEQDEGAGGVMSPSRRYRLTRWPGPLRPARKAAQ